MHTRLLICLLWVFMATQPQSFGQRREPVIDMHVHAHELWNWTDTAWYPQQFRRPPGSTALMLQTIAELKKNNVVLAVASGYSLKLINKWKDSSSGIFIGGYETDDPPSREEVEKLRQRVKNGDTRIFAEVSVQYGGVSPSDTAMEPLYNLAEELDIPIGIHIGIGPPGAANGMAYRSRLSSPLLLEEALVRHPKIRFYIMHAGWPMLDDMVAMLYAFPNLYVDISAINWYIPKAEFYTYLKRLTDAGFSGRIMYGSDQMQWPASISASIKEIEDAPFLSHQQKRDILYNNAARFLRLKQ